MEEWKDRDRRVFDMTPPSQRVTSEEVDWIIEQLQTKVKGEMFTVWHVFLPPSQME